MLDGKSGEVLKEAELYKLLYCESWKEINLSLTYY